MSQDTTTQSSEHTSHQGTTTGHEENANPQGGEVFTHLIDGLGDHHELNIFFQELPILPVILVDDGLHVYKNQVDMEAAGLYTIHNPKSPHKLVSTTKVDAKGNPVGPTFDLSITNFVAYEWIAMALVTVLFLIARRRYVKHPTEAPKGIQNMLEALVIYIRDDIVVPNVGTVRRAVRLMPFITAIFLFVLTLNLIGLLPGCHAATGALGVTMALALCSFWVINYIAFKDAGAKSWFHHLLGGAPWYMFLIMIPIEIASLFTKPFALMIRLFANMTAGHIVLLSLVGLVFFFKSWLVVPVSSGFSVFIYLIELLVAFLQAYIFAILTAVFVGLALGEHAHEDHHLEHEPLH